MCATPARHRARFQGEEETMQGFWSARSLVDPSRGGGAARHVRKTSSTYVLHIGRVGALAVSLGVGFAVANSAGVAYADSDADTSSSVSSDSQGGGAPARPGRSCRAPIQHTRDDVAAGDQRRLFRRW